MSQLTWEQRIELIDKFKDADKSGNEAEAVKLLRQIPISPWLAKAGKEVFGRDFLIENGYNLSEAEEEYGKDWLSE